MDPEPRGRLLRVLAARNAGRSAALVALLVLAGLFEGLGLLTLVPLVGVAVEGAPAPGLVERAVVALLGRIGLPVTLASLLGVLVVALVLKSLFRWVAMRQVGYAVARVSRESRLRLVRGLLASRWRYLAAQRSGDIATALSRDAFWGAYAYRHAVGAVASMIQLAVYAAAVLLVWWRVGVLALLGAAALSTLLGVFIRVSRRAGADQTRVSRSLVSRMLDVLGGLKAIKAMGRERWYLPVLEGHADELERAERRQVVATESLHSFQEPLLALLLAPVVYLALTRTEMTFASLAVGVFLFARLLGRAHQVQTEYQGIAAAEAALLTLEDQTVAADNEREAELPRRLDPRLDHGLELQDVRLGYGGRAVIGGASLTVPARRLTVLSGHSGAGKTTLLDLIAGLREPDGGWVLVDGAPLEELDRSAWRDRIGYVPQEPVLLQGSIASNVALGRDVSEREVAAALSQCGAAGLVRDLPDGIHTEVGERGAALSGGERQRVALARAVVHQPLLLVLDEPTSELDESTELEICELLRSLRHGVTIVAASHSGALVHAADHVYEVVGGRVMERAAL